MSRFFAVAITLVSTWLKEPIIKAVACFVLSYLSAIQSLSGGCKRVNLSCKV